MGDSADDCRRCSAYQCPGGGGRRADPQPFFQTVLRPTLWFKERNEGIRAQKKELQSAGGNEGQY